MARHSSLPCQSDIEASSPISIGTILPPCKPRLSFSISPPDSVKLADPVCDADPRSEIGASPQPVVVRLLFYLASFLPSSERPKVTPGCHRCALHFAPMALICRRSNPFAKCDRCELDQVACSLKDRKSTRLNSSHSGESRMPSSA